MKTHKDLLVYQKSIFFVANIYEITMNFPREEIYGIISQMRRAAVSIPSNIAEGAARQSNKEFVQFLHISLGSINELDTQLEISRIIGFINEERVKDLQKDLGSLKQMLLGLIKSIKNKSKM